MVSLMVNFYTMRLVFFLNKGLNNYRIDSHEFGTDTGSIVFKGLVIPWTCHQQAKVFTYPGKYFLSP